MVRKVDRNTAVLIKDGAKMEIPLFSTEIERMAKNDYLLVQASFNPIKAMILSKKYKNNEITYYEDIEYLNAKKNNRFVKRTIIKLLNGTVLKMDVKLRPAE